MDSKTKLINALNNGRAVTRAQILRFGYANPTAAISDLRRRDSLKVKAIVGNGATKWALARRKAA